MILPPPEMSGNSDFAKWCNRLLRYVLSLRPVESSTNKFDHTHIGVSWKSAPTSSSGVGTLNYLRTYDPTKTYGYGDIVRVKTGNAQGVWICVSDAPIINDPPMFPEPETLTPPGVNKWEIFSLGIQAAKVCQNGDKLIYVNASQPQTPPAPS